MADARVGRLSIRARSTRSPVAVDALSATEKAIRSALDRLTDSDELVVLRHVRLLARGTVNQPWELERELERQVTRLLRASIASATRFGDGDNLRSSPCVVFASEAVALAQYLIALERGRGEDWPFSALRPWGRSVPPVVAQAIQRGRAFSGDVLAELARSDALDVLLSVALKSAPARVEDLWLVTSGVGRDAIAGLPVQVLRELLQRLEQVLARYGPRGSFDGRLRELAIEHERAVRLVVLAELFLRWPPLRGSTIDAREIDEIARIAAPSDRKQRGVERRSLAPSSSRAGGLAFWARLVDSLDIGLDGVFSTPRLLEGVRWAIARSLEDGSMDRRDPLLLAWIGSEPDSVVAPAMGLSGEDPEPLFRVAMQALLRHGEAPGAVHLCRWGDLVVAFAGDVVLDIFASRSPHDIVPDLVKRLRARGLGVVPELHVDSDAWGQVADVLAELDTPAIPDAWRGAVLALTSLLRRRVRETHRAGIRELRKWQARLHDDRTIELRSHEIRSIDAGRWLGDGVVRLAGNRHRVREVSQF